MKEHLSIQDKYGKYVEEDKRLSSEEAKDIEDSAEADIKALTNTAFSYTEGTKVKSKEWERANRRAILDYRKIFNQNVRSGRFASLEDAKNDALMQVEKKFRLDDKSGTKSEYRQPLTATGDQQYAQNLDTARKAILAAPSMVNEHILPGVSAQNIKDAEKYITTGQGSMPRIFEDLAADSPKVTAWDLAQAQAKVLNPDLATDMKTPASVEFGTETGSISPTSSQLQVKHQSDYSGVHSRYE